jgi:hypothetical protein
VLEELQDYLDGVHRGLRDGFTRPRVFWSKRTDVMTLGVVEEQVDVSRHMAEHT